MASLTALTTLVLDQNQIQDVTPLASLTALTELDLQVNQIQDVTPLASLTALTELQLDEPDQEKGQEPLTTPVQVLLYLLVVGGSQSLLFSFPLLLFLLLKFLKIYIGVAGVKG